LELNQIKPNYYEFINPEPGHDFAERPAELSEDFVTLWSKELIP